MARPTRFERVTFTFEGQGSSKVARFPPEMRAYKSGAASGALTTNAFSRESNSVVQRRIRRGPKAHPWPPRGDPNTLSRGSFGQETPAGYT